MIVRVKLAVITALLFSTSTIANAQEVERLAFTDPAKPAQLKNEHVSEREGQGASLADAMATAFADLTPTGAAQTYEEIDMASSISVPLWMQTGVAPTSLYTASLDSYPSMSSGTVSHCGPPMMKPRFDLSRSAQRRRGELYPLVHEIACNHGVSPDLLDGLIVQESRYNPSALSHAGAISLTQLMPGTAREIGVSNPWDIVQNINGGAKYLKTQLDRFGRVDLALAAYNSGPNRVAKILRIPRIRETQDYVFRIMKSLSPTSTSAVERITFGSQFEKTEQIQQSSFERSVELVSFMRN